MIYNSNSDQSVLSPLELCLLDVAKNLERPITPENIYSMQSGEDGHLTINDLLELAQNSGLQAGYGKRKLSGFEDTLSPAIMLLKNGKAIVYHGRTSDGDLKVFDPRLGGGIGVLPAIALNDQYTGFAILFRRSFSDLPAAQSEQGHWFWSAMAANRWSYAQVGLAAALANLLGLSTSVFIMVVYDRVLPNEATESLIALTLGVGLALTFDFALKLLRAGFIDKAGQKADMFMGRRIFDQLLNIRMKSRTGSTGAMASTVREFETLREFFTSATLVALVDLPFIALFLLVIYMVGGPLAFVPAFAVPLVLFVGIAVQPILASLAEKSFRDGQSKQSVLVETISGLETIKTTAADRKMRTRWLNAIERQSSYGARSRSMTQFALNLTGFVQQAAQVLIVFYGVFLVTDGKVTMGALIASVMLTGRALAPLGQLAQTLTRINQARSAFRSLNELMKAESEKSTSRAWIRRPNISGRVTFKNVSFAYPDQSVDTLTDVSFDIEPGEKVAILGPIGSGKSTVARLLLGLYEPQSGSVMLDAVDIRQIDPGDLRRNIGSVLQNIWLFSGSIRENISSGTLRPRDEDILRAGQISGVEEFVRNQPGGYEQILAERGEGTSGGQCQAIALARALVGDPPVLLLDEPTSSMDVKTEAEVIRRLRQSTHNKTIIIVTHRTSLLELVDRVIVIEGGRVLIDGPKALLRQHVPQPGRHLNVAAS